MLSDADLGSAIRRQREKAGLSQAALAEKMVAVGTDATTFLVSRVEIGQRPCRAVELVAFARALGTTPEVLLYAASRDSLDLAMEDVTARREATVQAVRTYLLAAERALDAYDAADPTDRLRAGASDLDSLVARLVGGQEPIVGVFGAERAEQVRRVAAAWAARIEVVEEREEDL